MRIVLATALLLTVGTGLAGSGAASTLPPVRLVQAPAPASRPPAASGAITGAVGDTQTGLAAYYSQRLNGKRTASGERFDNGALTTAHQTLPFGTKVRITNVKNQKSVVLRVNDRGPTQPGRIVDVSRAAGQRLGFMRAGLVEVKLEVVEAATPRPAKAKK